MAPPTSLTVLLVDDDPDIRTIAALSLRKIAGWDVVAVASGAEAVAAVAAQRFDAVLLDVMMPGVDGLETLRQLRGPGHGDIPVILMTARVRQQDRAELERTSARGIIEKPFDPMTLHERVSEILR